MQIQPQYKNREEWARLAQQYGLEYEVLELSSPPAISDPELYAEVEKWYKESGCVGSVHGAFIDNNPASGDPLIAEISKKRCRESCELAVRLGAGQVVFHSGAFPFLRGEYLENWAVKCARFYESLAEEYGVKIFVENSMDVDPEPLRMLMENADSAGVGVCLDIGHANYSRVPVSEWVRVLHDHIGYIHLSDNMGLFDDHLPLGTGKVDFKEINGLFADFNGKITLETGSIEDTRRSIEFLEKNGFDNLRR